MPPAPQELDRRIGAGEAAKHRGPELEIPECLTAAGDCYFFFPCPVGVVRKRAGRGFLSALAEVRNSEGAGVPALCWIHSIFGELQQSRSSDHLCIRRSSVGRHILVFEG